MRASETLTTFGQFIRSARLGLDKTLEEVAAEVGVSRSRMNHYEIGLRYPSTRNCVLMAKILKLDLGELVQKMEESRK